MLCVYLQTFEAALFLEEEEEQSHINKLPDVFIDNNRECNEDGITEEFNTFFANIGSNLAKWITLLSGSFLMQYQTLIGILCC